MGIAENSADPIGLAQFVPGEILEGALGAQLDALRMSSAQVAFERSGNIVVDEDSPEGT